MTAAFDAVKHSLQAKGGDKRIEYDLLRKTRLSIRFGKLNHCTFDETNPTSAKCLQDREAMERLLSGRPQRTDGRLIKNNLFKEADVSRATMNRAHTIMAEWDQRTAATGSRTTGEARRDDQITDLKARLKAKTSECTNLQERLDASATTIVAMHHDNQALRAQLERCGHVLSLPSGRSGDPG